MHAIATLANTCEEEKSLGSIASLVVVELFNKKLEISPSVTHPEACRVRD